MEIFNFLIGFISYFVTILVLESVTQKEKIIGKISENIKENSVTDNILEIESIVQNILHLEFNEDSPDYKQSIFELKDLYSKLNSRLKYIQHEMDDILFINTYFKYISKFNHGWYNQKNVRDSYLQKVSEISSDIYKLQIQRQHKTF